MVWIQICIVVFVIGFALYRYGTKNLDYWKRKGIKHEKPLPFFGNSLPLFLRRVDARKYMQDFYDSMKQERFSGIYLFLQPALLIRDPEILRQIMIKDADHFINRINWTQTSDPFFSQNLSTLQGQKWRNLRMVMTSVFTSAKMKDMFGFMNKCAEQSINYLAEKLEKNGTNSSSGEKELEMEMKNYFSRYGTDVIASTAFGFEVNSFENPGNEFCQLGMKFSNGFSSFPLIKILFMVTFPKIAKALEVSFFAKRDMDFFVSLVKETIRSREEKGITRKDVIQILTEARKEKDGEKGKGKAAAKLPGLNDVGIASQAMSFFFGGFDILATALSFACYELALNPDVQAKLQTEIDQILEKDNAITYDGVIRQMQYLDMVVKETLRKWPPAVLTDREVSKTYVIPKTETTPEVTLDVGDTIIIPIMAIHYDPNHFPDPESFDPERFRDEKNDIKPFTYIPFGAGLRQCIAMRYALMEIKVGLVHLLKRFSIAPSKNTAIPIKLSQQNAFALKSEKGIWLGLRQRS